MARKRLSQAKHRERMKENQRENFGCFGCLDRGEINLTNIFERLLSIRREKGIFKETISITVSDVKLVEMANPWLTRSAIRLLRFVKNKRGFVRRTDVNTHTNLKL